MAAKFSEETKAKHDAFENMRVYDLTVKQLRELIEHAIDSAPRRAEYREAVERQARGLPGILGL